MNKLQEPRNIKKQIKDTDRESRLTTKEENMSEVNKRHESKSANAFLVTILIASGVSWKKTNKQPLPLK